MSARINQLASEDWRELDLLLRGFQISRMLRLVADLGIADKVAADGRVAVNDLAEACAVLPEQLIRVLRALAAFHIFQVNANGIVAHTTRSQLLCTDVPNSMHHCARFWTAPGAWKAWGMLDAAMTGGTPYEAAWNTSRFSYLRQHPDEARAFDAMMATFPDNRHSAIATGYDFSRVRMIADIGGGNGRHVETNPYPLPRRAWPYIRARGRDRGVDARRPYAGTHRRPRWQLFRDGAGER